MLLELLISLLAGTSLSVFYELILQLIKRIKGKHKDDLVDRIKSANRNLNVAMEDITHLQNELKRRVEIVENLKQEALEAEKIIEISAEQVQAIRSAINMEISKNSRKSFWKGVFVNFIFFVLGTLASYFI